MQAGHTALLPFVQDVELDGVVVRNSQPFGVGPECLVEGSLGQIQREVDDGEVWVCLQELIHELVFKNVDTTSVRLDSLGRWLLLSSYGHLFLQLRVPGRRHSVQHLSERESSMEVNIGYLKQRSVCQSSISLPAASRTYCRGIRLSCWRLRKPGHVCPWHPAA